MSFSWKHVPFAAGLVLAGLMGGRPAIATDVVATPDSPVLKQTVEEAPPEAMPTETLPAEPDASEAPIEEDAPAVEPDAEDAAPLAEDGGLVPIEERASEERVALLLEMTNTDELSVQVMESLMGQFRQMAPDVPDEWWDGFMAEVNSEELNSLILPLYQQNFTEPEIEAMIAFYETPEGQSMVEKLPMVMQASLEAGQQWGIQIAQRLISELEEDGFSPGGSTGETAPAPPIEEDIESVPDAPEGAE